MSATFSEHNTVTTGAETRVTATDLDISDGTFRLRVINRTGTGEIYFNVSIDPNNPADAPTAGAPGTYVLPAVISEEFVPVPGFDRYLDVRMIADGADTEFSVVLDAAHARFGA